MNTKEFVVLRGLEPYGDVFVWVNELHVEGDYFTIERGYSDKDCVAIDALDIGQECAIADAHVVRRIS